MEHETALQAIEHLGRFERLQLVNAQGKAGYFDQGLLRSGMIRAPLYAVERQLARRSKFSLK